MKYPKLSIHIVTWNSLVFLPELLESIMAQTYKQFNVLIIDNGSTDGTERFLRKEYPEITFLRNARNLGFSVAHNQGIRYAIEHWPKDQLDDSFILLTNPDTIFTPTFLEELMLMTSAHPGVGSFGGKLLRAFSDQVQDEVFKRTIRSDRIDSVGISATRSTNFADRGAGELDVGQYDQTQKVFGISGALTLCRASALEQIRFDDEIFDASFFAYKEDVDLAWRLQYAGWDSLYVPQAVAYHYRGMYGPEKSSLWDKIKNRKEKSSLRNFFSTRNHWFLLMKNLSIKQFILYAPWIIPHEVARLIYVCFWERTGWRALKDVIIHFPNIRQKRRQTIKTAKRTFGDLRIWFMK